MVRYVGEPVAAVFAETPGAAEDAAELVTLEVEPLDPALSLSGRGASGGEALRTAEAATIRKAFGDLHAAFHEADRIVETRLALARDGAVPLETRGVVARWDAGRDVLEIWGGAKVPHASRDALADMLGRSRAGVVLHAGHVGGSFGVRGEIHPEDVLVAHAARVLERPVRWIEDRREHLCAASQARGIEARVRAAVADDGTLLGLDLDYSVDQGAYVRTEGTMVADLVAALTPGPYRLEAYRAAGHVRMTNRTPAGTARGAGRVEATFIRERVMDAIAAEAGLDPMELRRRNLPPADEGPLVRPVEALGTPVTLDAARTGRLVDQAVKRFSLDLVRRRAQDRRAAGELAGVGMALFVEASGAGPPERVTVGVDRRGAVEVVTGAVDQGQGLRTLIAQIVGDILGVDYDAVRVTCGGTGRIDHSGGTWLSRSSVIAGTAAQHAAESLRETILSGAEAMLEVPQERLTIQSGRIREADRHFGTSLDLGDLSRAMEPGGPLAAGSARGLSAEGTASAEAMTCPFGLAVAVAGIDPMTGIVRVPRAFVAYEVGNAINPALVEGQILGGALHGIGGALCTSLEVGETGDPVRAGLADYLMPTAGEAPLLDVLITEDAPAETVPLGLKGAGDGAVSGMGAAVAAAVDEALGAPGFVTRLPIEPARVLARLKERGHR
jgi:CO/xanthine dehydrogenase Mo-binding subunit